MPHTANILGWQAQNLVMFTSRALRLLYIFCICLFVCTTTLIMYEIMTSRLIAVMWLYTLVDLTAALSTGVHVATMTYLV